MTADGSRKGRKRRDAGGGAAAAAASSTQSPFPSDIVCSAHDLATNKSAMEMAVLLIVAVVCLYFYALAASMKALPDPIPLMGGHHMGGINLNVARFEDPTVVVGGGGAASGLNDVQREMQQQQQKQIGEIPIPVGKWPISLRDEPGNYETILHVGDGTTPMKVPRFWSPPLHNKRLFTREQAMQVGTCAEPDPQTGSSVRGEQCPPDQRTIFVAIASYRDYQCRYTLESAFLRAVNPHRIRVGVVDQIVEGEDDRCDEPIQPCETNPNQALCLYKDQIDVYTMPAPLSVGPVFARHIGHRMYRGEYYATQSDAHVTFTTNWDSDIIEQMEATHNEMTVLTTYLTDIQGSIDEKTGRSLRHTRPIMCNTYYEGGQQGMHLRHGSQPERQPTIHGMPQLQPWWAAGYSFSRGHFVVNVPYDYLQPMIFQGEEMSIGIRGFTVGYDYYANERSVCFHHYATGKNAEKRNKVKHFWENGDRYKGTGKKAMQRLLGIVHMNPEVDPSEWDHTDEDRYGLGGVRTPEKFYTLFGIDVVKKETEGHLCQFVGDTASMHKLWTPLLRPDGMGIDYSTVDFSWKDPNPKK